MRHPSSDVREELTDVVGDVRLRESAQELEKVRPHAGVCVEG
jgi:hypothetical protein